MNNNDDFFEQNDIRIGEGKDFGSSIPIYYQSLGEAFFQYFNTIRSLKDSYNLLFEDFWKRESLSFNFHTNITRDISFSILGFHRFFELLLKDILRKIDPFLAVKFLENENQVIKYLNKQLNPETVYTIEFNESLKRFQEALKWYNSNPTENQSYKIASDFSFLIRDDTLVRLTKWRNRIMHNGTTMPNIFQLDYLVTQRIVPLILEIIVTNKSIFSGKLPHYFETFTGIKIIDEISKIKFHYKDFSNTAQINELQQKYFKLAHLKELGRATYHLSPFLKKNMLYYENYYKEPQARYKRFAESERIAPQFHALKNCPCCGFETLVVYKLEYFDIFYKTNTFFSWFNCTTCGYSLKSNLPDPTTYGFSKEYIFAQS